MSKVVALLETGSVFGGYLTVCKYMIDSAENTIHFSVLGYLLCVMLLFLLHQLWPVLHEESKRSPTFRANYRKHSDPGLWCCLLLPIAFITHVFNGGDNSYQMDVFFLSVTVLLVLVHYNPSKVTQITAALMFLWLRPLVVKSDLSTYIVCGSVIALFYTSLTLAPNVYPRCFSEGETALVMQIITFGLYKICMTFFKGNTDIVTQIQSLQEGSKLCLIAILGVFVASVLAWCISTRQHPKRFYIAYGTAASTVVLPLMFIAFEGNPFQQLYFYLVKNRLRVLLLSWWTLLAFAALVTVCMASTSGKTNTRVRKIFHLIICAVYIPGLYYDPDLLCTGSVIALGVMIILETIRLLKVPPLGGTLHSSYGIFLDKQDEGELILTPIYLLCGFSMPVWITRAVGFQKSLLSLYAGVLSVGIGDSMASVCGSKFGKYKLPGSNKTIEGIICSVISQVIAVGTVLTLTYDNMIAILLTALLEASTKQIDNLILPLFMYSLLLRS